MNMDRFKYRVAFRQEDGSFRRYEVVTLAYRVSGLIAEYTHCERNTAYIGKAIIDGVNVILEQCTGLKDKNGKLIYEGDKCLAFGQEGIIKWMGSGFYFTYEYGRVPAASVELEIIGNIHDEAKESEGNNENQV